MTRGGGWPRCQGQRLEKRTDGELEGAQGRGRGSTLAAERKRPKCTRRPGSWLQVRRLRWGTAPSRQPVPSPLPCPAPCCRTRRWQARWCSCPRTSPPPSCQPAAWSHQCGALMATLGHWSRGSRSRDEARAAAGNQRWWWWQRRPRLYVPRDSRRMWRLLGRPLGAPLCPVGRDWLSDPSLGSAPWGSLQDPGPATPTPEAGCAGDGGTRGGGIGPLHPLLNTPVPSRWQRL